MNKGLFYSGLGILIFQSLVGLFLLLSSMQISERTGNILVGLVFFGSLTIASVIMMLVGAFKE